MGEHSQHTHDHSHGIQPGDISNNKAFVIGIILNVLFVIAEVIAGLINNSMSLLTDAGHNASDVVSLLLSLLAFKLAKSKSNQKYTYGLKKTTVLAALTNAVILLVAIGIIGYEAVRKLNNPTPIQGDVIAWVAALGIAINLITALLFYKNRKKDLNIKSAYLHMIADTLVSVGVLVGGIIISQTNWYWIDPVIAFVVIAVILFSTWSLLLHSFRMAVDAVPEGIDLEEIKKVIKGVGQVNEVHHVHIWSISTTENALTAHVVGNPALSFSKKMEVVKKIKHELQHYQVGHSTIELADNSHEPASEKPEE